MDAQTITIIVVFAVNLILSALVGAAVASYTIGQYKEKVDSLKEDKEKLFTKQELLRTDVDRLLEFKVITQKFLDRNLFESHSPLQLTAVGKELVSASGFKLIFELLKDDLAKKLGALGPKTKYDVQEKALTLMDSLTEYDPFAPIKTYAFNNGKDFGQILRAGAILLRDYYLEKHPEITQ
jgi:hypothetical protein